MDAQGVWRLAPLYDFTFHAGPNGWQTLSVAGEGRNPGRQDLLRLADQADLKPREAREIVEQVRAAIAGFDALARKLELARTTRDRVRARFLEIDQQ